MLLYQVFLIITIIVNKNILIEKTTGFNLKYPNVYDHIVFNTNPILFEEWSEFVEQTNCTELIMYRFVEDGGDLFQSN